MRKNQKSETGMRRSRRLLVLLLSCSILFSIGSLTGCSAGDANTPANAEGNASEGEGEETAPPPVNANKTHTFLGFSENMAARLDGIADDYGAVAVQVALFNGGDEILTYSCGYADWDAGRKTTTETKYRVASLSKLVTAVVFMAAKDRGIVDENEDISVYFGEPCYNPRFPDVPITPAMLMTHTSSLDSDGDSLWEPGLLSRRSIYLAFEPGTRYSYSNTGYGVLSCLLEKATGRPFNALAKEYLFDPLGIDASYVYDELNDQTDVGVLYGEGGLTISELADIRPAQPGLGLGLSYGNLIISAKDYVKILSMLAHGGVSVDGKTVLSRESAEALLERRIETDGYGVAFGSQIQANIIPGATVYVHTGSAVGMFSTFVFDPETDRAAAVFSTGEPRYIDPESEVYRLCLDAIRIVWAIEPAAKPTPDEKIENKT